MLTIAFNSMLNIKCISQTFAATIIIHICFYMIPAAAPHNCATLTYMSWLTTTVFEAAFIVLRDTFETSELILGQITYTPLSAAAAMHPCNLPCP